MLKWLKFTIIRKTELDRLKSQAKKNDKVIANLMSMNHHLIQVFNKVPVKYKKGLTIKK